MEEKTYQQPEADSSGPGFRESDKSPISIGPGGDADDDPRYDSVVDKFLELDVHAANAALYAGMPLKQGMAFVGWMLDEEYLVSGALDSTASLMAARPMYAGRGGIAMERAKDVAIGAISERGGETPGGMMNAMFGRRRRREGRRGSPLPDNSNG